jgi:hypothetical protein
MSKLGPRGWSTIGEWWGLWCVVLPIVIVLIGLLIMLVAAALSWTPLGPIVNPWLLFVEKVLAIIALVLMFGGTLLIGSVFVSDLFWNFVSNWRSSGRKSAWNTLKGEVVSCGKSFVSGFKKAIVPLVDFIGGLKNAWPF